MADIERSARANLREIDIALATRENLDASGADGRKAALTEHAKRLDERNEELLGTLEESAVALAQIEGETHNEEARQAQEKMRTPAQSARRSDDLGRRSRATR